MSTTITKHLPAFCPRDPATLHGAELPAVNMTQEQVERFYAEELSHLGLLVGYDVEFEMTLAHRIVRNAAAGNGGGSYERDFVQVVELHFRDDRRADEFVSVNASLRHNKAARA